ncbi:response regulator [Chryseobacterium sp.]|uniref:response regulator n=1 Tax=Chryseobacterium sp. TaxID=1871047 RepID=UPI002896C04B|nr:response regulator [Chryseobacterium sp.]
MNSIIVNDDFSQRKMFENLISESENVHLLSSFDSTEEAVAFLYKHKVDLIFFDIQISDSGSLEFLNAVPKDVFVIFISFLRFKNSKFDLSNQFQKSLNQAMMYSVNPHKTDDYFVI